MYAINWEKGVFCIKIEIHFKIVVLDVIYDITCGQILTHLYIKWRYINLNYLQNQHSNYNRGYLFSSKALVLLQARH